MEIKHSDGTISEVAPPIKESCANCKFAKKHNDIHFECRRYPKTVVINQQKDVYPSVECDDWCGEWKVKS